MYALFPLSYKTPEYMWNKSYSRSSGAKGAITNGRSKHTLGKRQQYEKKETRKMCNTDPMHSQLYVLGLRIEEYICFCDLYSLVSYVYFRYQHFRGVPKEHSYLKCFFPQLTK
jgi:hypothetical protein